MECEVLLTFYVTLKTATLQSTLMKLIEKYQKEHTKILKSEPKQIQPNLIVIHHRCSLSNTVDDYFGTKYS